MDDLNFVETIRERDIDLLIMEEVFSSELFRKKLLDLLNIPDKNLSFWGCWHSVMDNELGETDVLVGFKNPNNEKIVIMLENKIDAGLQPMQPERYILRGEKGIEKKLWDKYYICLTAPKSYIDSVKKEDFKYSLSYEEIYNIIEASDMSDDRTAFKLQMIETAIDKKKRGYSFTTDETVTMFWQRYYDYLSNNFPNIITNKPSNKPSNSDWVHFRKPILEKPFSIVHKWKKGCVDLQIQIDEQYFDEIKQIIKLPDGASFVQTGKSLSIRKQELPINKFKSFDDQIDNIHKSMQGISELLELYEEYKIKVIKVVILI